MMALLALVAMLVGAVAPAHAVCGLMAASMAVSDDDAPHTGHADLAPDSMVMTDAGSETSAGQADMNSCGMCVGDGVCDHGTCTIAMVSAPDRYAERPVGDHERSLTHSMRSWADGYQLPPPRLLS
ncbi:MAG: hypothetical protein P1U65_11850 [Minwuia sp.]|nr:hypothetical protein [Minwuia sp.]